MPKRKTRDITERSQAVDLGTDVQALVLNVLRESYRQTVEDLRSFAEKVRYLNESKKALRAYLAALGDFRAQVIHAARSRGVTLCREDQKALAVLANVFDECAHAYNVGDVEYALCIPDRVPVSGLNSLAQLDSEIVRWEERLATTGDDAQLANVDLQNGLQKMQQTLQMMSNISKMLHDTTMAVIRKIGD
jgi:hypothetical protein